MFWNLALTTGLMATVASASASSSYAPISVRDDLMVLSSRDVLERSYGEVTSNHGLSKRQNQQFESTVTLNPDGSINLDSWNEETERACQDSLKRLQIATNPSGTCICYNLPSLDTNTGVFEADLRVYKFNEPNGAFAGVQASQIGVGLMYIGASVSPVSADTMRNLSASTGQPTITKRQDTTTISQPEGAPDLELLQQYLLVGQIDNDRMAPNLSMAELEALVMPVLTLTAQNTTGQTVSTNVSSNEAVFVTGVFSREIVMSDFALASAAVDTKLEQLANKTVAFVLPGVQLMIYPIGLIITSVWLVLGVLAYGIGTYDRIRYADAYRRRSARANDTKGRI